MPEVSPYLADADKAADLFAIPREIFRALINRESGWNAWATGSAGEVGLTQIKPSSAAEVGYSPYSPQENLKAGAAYLKKQFSKFGNWGDALAAYNAGAGNIQAGKKYSAAVMKAAEIEKKALPATPADAAKPDEKSFWSEIGDYFRGAPAPGGAGDPTGPMGMPMPLQKLKEGATGVVKYGAAGVVVLILLTAGIIILGVSSYQHAKKAV